MMGRQDAERELTSLGYRVVDQDGAIALKLDDHVLSLGRAPDWDGAVDQAKDWLDNLVDRAGRDGATLGERRRALGFHSLADFCARTGLNANHVFEAEAGMADCQPVHAKVLDWLERGKLDLSED